RRTPKNFRIAGLLPLTDTERKAVASSEERWSSWPWIIGIMHRELLGQVAPPIRKPQETSAAVPSQNIRVAANRQNIFSQWRNYHSTAIIREIQRAARTAQHSLNALATDASEEEKTAVLRSFVKAVNQLNSKQQFVNSVDRDDLVEFLLQLGASHGLDSDVVRR